MHKLIEYICDELEELEKKAEKGGLNSSEIQYADTLAHLKKNLLKGEELYEEMDGEYSGAMPDGMRRDRVMTGGSYRRGSYARGDGRGRGSRARRDAMGRYSSDGYSRDAADMKAELEDMMNDPKYEPVRADIERLMHKVEAM